jgi:hydrogenase maturation protease
MSDLVSSDTIVIGVGNTIFSDDGVGVHAARLLQIDPRVPAGVTILDGGTLGLGLIPYVSDASRVLFLDAVNVGDQAGKVVRMAGDQLHGFPCGAGVHQLGVAVLPLVSNACSEIVLLGVQPASTDWGTSLTPQVQAALGSLVDAAIEQLLEWAQRGTMRLAEPAGAG